MSGRRDSRDRSDQKLKQSCTVDAKGALVLAQHYHPYEEVNSPTYSEGEEVASMNAEASMQRL